MYKRFSWALLALALALPVQASVIIADHSLDYGVPPGATGWSYLWSEAGVIGTSSNYQNLQLNTVASMPDIYGVSSTGSFPWSGPLGFYWNYISAAQIHPGPGGGFTILAYQVQSGEQGRVDFAGSFRGVDPLGAQSSDGWQVMVYVNDALVPTSSIVVPWTDVTQTYNYDLGHLNAGDTVYFAVNSNVLDWYDTAAINMVLTSDIPEPATFALVGAGVLLVGLLRRRA